MAAGKARLLKTAGLGGDGPLDVEQFSGDLCASKLNKVVYSESHDEAGNAGGTQRTIVCAVNGAPLVGATRTYAEARCRVAFGLSLLSAGTPMFFMGEEVGADKPYRFNDFLQNREDLAAERASTGARLFCYYQDLIRFSRRHPATRSQDIDIIHVIGGNRLIAFTRSAGSEKLLIVASLRNQPFLDGYVIQTDPWRLPEGSWREIDLAQVIVAILENPVTHRRKTYRLCGPEEHTFAEVAEIASSVLGTQVTYQQANVDAFAESLGQTGNALFKEHCRATAVEAQEGVFAGTNSLVAQISGRPPMTIEEFVATNRAAFVRTP
jgi:hypothetical protein